MIFNFDQTSNPLTPQKTRIASFVNEGSITFPTHIVQDFLVDEGLTQGNAYRKSETILFKADFFKQCLCKGRKLRLKTA